MPRKFYKHKLLLDEGFHLRQRFPILNNRFDVKHVASDLKYRSLPDDVVYKLAQKESRLLVTYNIQDFQELVKAGDDTGIIGVSPNLSLEQIDKKLTAILIRAGKRELFGKFTSVKW